MKYITLTLFTFSLLSVSAQTSTTCNEQDYLNFLKAHKRVEFKVYDIKGRFGNIVRPAEIGYLNHVVEEFASSSIPCLNDSLRKQLYKRQSQSIAIFQKGEIVKKRKALMTAKRMNRVLVRILNKILNELT